YYLEVRREARETCRTSEFFWMEGGRTLPEPLLQLVSRIGTQGQVANLAPGTQRLAVNVEVRIGNCENLAWLRQFANQIQHRAVAQSARIAERQTGHGAKMVFKLAGDRAFDRPMAGIVNARRHFICEQAAVAFKKFHREHTNIIKFFEDPPRSILCLDRK